MSYLNDTVSISTIEITPSTTLNPSNSTTSKRKSSISSSKSSRTQSFKSAENNGENAFERIFQRHQTVRNSKQTDNFETIALQGSSSPPRRPLQLKASFLKRKTREYEGDFSLMIFFFIQQSNLQNVNIIMNIIECETSNSLSKNCLVIMFKCYFDVID